MPIQLGILAGAHTFVDKFALNEDVWRAFGYVASPE